jgi:ABC-type cobalamin/Fe3+-siderophores transport system ATPase subunit
VNSAAQARTAWHNSTEASRATGEIRLSVEQVSYAYSANPTQAPLFTLEANSFQARPGEIVAILGPNASGKSTLLKLIAGALEPLSGRVLLNGFVTHSLSPRIRAQRIAMVQQESRLLFPSRAWEFVLQGRHAYGRALRFETADDVLIAKNALAQVGAEHLSDRWMDQISGGEKQRVILARALSQQPLLLLLDEPTLHLDIGAQVDLLDALRRGKPLYGRGRNPRVKPCRGVRRSGCPASARQKPSRRSAGQRLPARVARTSFSNAALCGARFVRASARECAAWNVAGSFVTHPGAAVFLPRHVVTPSGPSRPSPPPRTSCSGRRFKAVADARLYGGKDTAQATAANRWMTRSGPLREQTGDVAGRPRIGPPTIRAEGPAKPGDRRSSQPVRVRPSPGQPSNTHA